MYVRKMDVTFRGTMRVEMATGLHLESKGTMTGTVHGEMQGKAVKMKIDMTMKYKGGRK